MSVQKSVLLFFVFFLCESLSFCETSKLDEICHEGMQMAMLLQSVHYEFLSKVSPPTLEGNEEGPLAVQTVTVWQSGHNIRTHTEYLPKWDKRHLPLDSLIAEGIDYAYNGNHYQWFSPGLGELTFSSQCRHPTPYWVPNLLIYPYYWLNGQQVYWSDIKYPELWLNRFKESQYVGEKLENGMMCDVVSMPCPKLNAKEIQVYFSKDLGYYPIKWIATLQQNELSTTLTMNLTHHKIFDIDGKKFIFPEKVIAEHVGREKEGIVTTRLQLILTEPRVPLRINPQLDEELFTISPSLAKTVTDYDAELESGRIQPSTGIADDGPPIKYEPTKYEYESLKSETLKPAISEKKQWDITNVILMATIILMAANVLLLAFLLFSIFYSRRNRQGKNKKNNKDEENDV
jgi:hypothetical protein